MNELTAGNASVLLGTASGIHGEHSKRYLRYMQLNKESEVAKLLDKNNPHMVEQSLYNGNDFNVAFPIVTNDGAIFKESLKGVKQLEYVVKAQKYWVDNGKNDERCTQPFLKHNVSNTIDVANDGWDDVADYIFDNRDNLCGVSLNSATGDKAYAQSPFTEVLTEQQIVDKYGVNSMFTSALIEAGLDAFPKGLWAGMNTAMGIGEKPKVVSENAKMIEWIRRFKKFTTRFMEGVYNDDIKHTHTVITRKVDDVLLELDYVNDKIYSLDLSKKPNTGDYNNVEDHKESLKLEIIKKDYEETLEIYRSSLNENEYHQDFLKAMAICINCVKDVYLLHKWEKINVEFKDFAWESKLTEKQYTDVDTIAAEACAGGQCEI